MKAVLKLLASIKNYKAHTAAGILFHLLTALFTVVSIPLVIPFFQILFGQSPSDFTMPQDPWDIEQWLSYGFSRLIAISDYQIALKVVCVTVIIVFLFKNLFRFLTNYFMISVRNGMARDLRLSIWKSFENMGIRERKMYEKGHLMSLMSHDLAEVDHGILNSFELLFRTPLIVLSCLVLMMLINLKLFCLSLVLVLFSLLIVGRLSHALKRQSKMLQSFQSKILQAADELISGIRILKVYNALEFVRSKFTRLNREHYRMNNRVLRRRELASPLSEFFGVVSIVFLLYFGTLEVLDGNMAAASFFAFIYAFYNVIDPAKSFSREYANLQRGLASLNRIQEFTSVIPEESLKNTEISCFEKELRFTNVVFSYPERGTQPVLNGLNLEIIKGSKSAIVGSSGAGKSCLLDLLFRFYKPDNGSISLDGQNVDRIPLNSYRALFSYVSQESILFNASWEENISLLEGEDFDTKAFEHAINQTDLHEIIQLRMEDPDFRIGDQGMSLSGGEKQRICLARAIYRDAEIMVLDEPTNALDKISEKKMIASILKAIKDRTSIIITHNLNLLKQMDTIYVLNDGKIVQSGSYAQLASHGGLFRDLLMAQTIN